MLRKIFQRIKQDRRLLVVIIILTIVSSVFLYNTVFISTTAIYPQVVEINYELSGSARETSRKWDFEALKEEYTAYYLDIEVKVYDVQGNLQKVNVWFRYGCDPNVYPCKGLQISTWSGSATYGESPPAIVHGINADREWLWWSTSETGGVQKAVVEATISITYIGEGTSINADDMDYYLLDITPEDTEGNKATWQYRIDNTYIDRPDDWEDDPFSGLWGGDDNGIPSFEFLSVLMVIPIIVGLKKKRREENG